MLRRDDRHCKGLLRPDAERETGVPYTRQPRVNSTLAQSA
jgi:hypothetical protein